MGGKLKGLSAGLLVLAMGMTALADGNADYKIEQVYINMPEVTAYYRSPDAEGEVEAFLDGEQLALQEVTKFEECGEPIEYYILVDVSASISGSRFEDIRASLIYFRARLRAGDRMVLMTFGDTVQTVLDGTEGQLEAETVLNQLTNPDQNTALFEAIDEAADQIWSAGDTSEKHRAVLVISDGKDCADNTRSVESVESRLISRGIPLYTLAVENNEGDSETEIASYRGNFSTLARNTGGVPWVSSEETSVLDGLYAVRDAIMGSYRAKFLARTNEISNRREDFVMKFLSAGEASDTVSILVERAQADTVAPEVEAASEEANSITLRYSEEVRNADVVNNYSVKKNGRRIPVQQVIQSADEESTYILVFGDDLYEGDYIVQITNVTDVSNEKNALKTPFLSLHTEWPEPEPETESEATALVGQNGKDESEPQTDEKSAGENEAQLGMGGSGESGALTDGEGIGEHEAATGSEDANDKEAQTGLGSPDESEALTEEESADDDEAKRDLGAVGESEPQTVAEGSNEHQAVTEAENSVGNGSTTGLESPDESEAPTEEESVDDNEAQLNLESSGESEPQTEAEGAGETDAQAEETTTETESAEAPEEPGEEAERTSMPGKWWLLILAGVLLAVLLLIAVIVRGRKKKAAGRVDEEVVDEKLLQPDTGGNRKHVAIDTPPVLPSLTVTLWISNGQAEAEKMDLTINGSCIIGRSKQCDVYCDDPMMSKQHFVLEVDNGNLFITDLESMNGTAVNGVAISGRSRLQPSDEVQAGNLRFRLEWEP